MTRKTKIGKAPVTKRFNGRHYVKVGAVYDKSGAKRKASKIRKDRGWNARIVKLGSHWYVYGIKKKGRR